MSSNKIRIDRVADGLRERVSDLFSKDYPQARKRFLAAADAAGAMLLSYPLSYDKNLAIDVAVIRRCKANRTVVVSSGVHGVEGFLGSACQSAWLKRLNRGAIQTDARVVLIHAVNPYGFANLRRCNEDNIDLNRNFVAAGQTYEGATKAYQDLDPLLNPSTPPGAADWFRYKAMWVLARKGLATIKQAVAGGQYEFPKGLFFGGKQPAESTRVVMDNYRDWIGSAGEVVHVDLHSGLGKRGSCKLLLHEQSNEHCNWYRELFGEEFVEANLGKHGTAYETQGSLGGWLHNHCKDLNFRFATAEFGTHGPLRVLSGLRAENRAHHFSRNDLVKARAKHELLECFCPRSTTWRKSVSETAVRLITKACVSASDSANTTSVRV